MVCSSDEKWMTHKSKIHPQANKSWVKKQLKTRACHKASDWWKNVAQSSRLQTGYAQGMSALPTWNLSHYHLPAGYFPFKIK
jgi:hypothetical protein